MKIIATIIRNGISKGIPEGTKVPEKPEYCPEFRGTDCQGSVCHCCSKQSKHNEAIQALISVAIQFEDQEAVKKLLTDQSNYTDKGELTTALFFNDRFKDGIYPLEGVNAEQIYQSLTFETPNDWEDTCKEQYRENDKSYRTCLRLIPQPNSEQPESTYNVVHYPLNGDNDPRFVEGTEVSEAIKEAFPNADIVIMGPIGDPIYQNWLKFPPKFYCANYSNADLPPLYCTKQCKYCTPNSQRKPVGVEEKKEPDYDRDQFLNERDSVSERSEEPTQETIDFATWYSGMERSKVLKAYERYKKETTTSRA